MDIRNMIATLPTTLLSLILILEINRWVTSPVFWKISLFSAFYFLLLIFFIKLVFWGKFNGRSSELDHTDYTIIARAYSALIILMFFFGVLFLEMAREAFVATSYENVSLPLLVGFIVACAISIIQHRLSIYLNIEYTLSNVKFTDFKKYLVWYHYIALFLLTLVVYGAYFAD